MIYGWKKRQEHIEKYGWFILSNSQIETLQTIFEGKKVVEVFAGKGYLASKMKPLMGKNYKAYDNAKRTGNWDSGTFPLSVTTKNALMAPIKKADVVVMTWPEYGSPLAYKVARKMSPGSVLFYEGEDEGGCTGDDKFFEYLDTHFTTLAEYTDLLNADHESWDGVHDDWHVLIKL